MKSTTVCGATAVHLYIGWGQVFHDDDPMWLHISNTCGLSGLVERLAEMANSVVWAATQENLYAQVKGVFQYEVIEPLGAWIATRASFGDTYDEEGPLMPEMADIIEEMRKLVAASVVRWELAEHTQGGAR